MEFRMTFIISLLFVEILELIICMKIQTKEMVHQGIPEIGAGDDNRSESLEEFWNQMVSESASGTEINHTSREVPCVEKSNMPRTRSPSENPFFSTSVNEEIIEIASNYEGTLGEKLPSIGFYCYDCQFYFRNSRTYEGHFRKMHLDKKAYPCLLCNSSYTTLYLYAQHAFFHEGMKVLKCEDCDTRFITKYDMKYHKCNPNADDPFRCNLCNIRFERSDDLEDHQIVCKEIRGKEETKNKCQSLFNLLNGRNSDESQICKTCGLKLQSLVQLRQHNRENHPKSRGFFPCDKCKKTFVSNGTLDIHINKYHNNSGEIAQKKKRAKEKHECHVCREEIKYLKEYINHFKTRHPDDKPFICEICRKGYISKPGLTEHVLTHKSEHIPCLHCANFFSSKKELRRHEKVCRKKEEIISRKTSFFCHICNKQIYGGYKMHKFKHGTFDYCEFCNRRFRKESNPQGLSTHVAKRHPNRSNMGVKYSSNTEEGIHKN